MYSTDMQYITGYERKYSINEQGQIYSHGRKIFLKPVINHHGYPMVCLYKDKKSKMHMIHRLVAQAYIPNPNGWPYINHKDGVRDNYEIDNLEWCTQSYNLKDMMKRGTHYALRQRKLTMKQARKVRELYLEGWTVREIAKEMGLSSTSTHHIIKGYHYRIYN